MGETVHPRVMFVDDEELILNALARMFRREALDVSVFSSPLAALEAIAREAFDVIVSDFRMPELIGTELLARARIGGSSAIGILVTGQADQVAIKRALFDGDVQVVLPKPWDPVRLRSTILQAAAVRTSGACVSSRLTRSPGAQHAS